MKLPHLLSEIYEIENGSNGMKASHTLPIQSSSVSLLNDSTKSQLGNHLNEVSKFAHSNALFVNQISHEQIQPQLEQKLIKLNDQQQYQIIQIEPNDFNIYHQTNQQQQQHQFHYRSQQQQQQHQQNLNHHEMVLIQAQSNQAH
jgi:hypothetical protein